MLQKHFFLQEAPTLTTIFFLSFDSSIGSSILEKFALGFHFLFHLVYTKVHFYFEGVSKNCESVKMGKK